MKLTDIKCRNSNAGSNKLKKFPDGGGLYLWVYADGKKYWRFRYARDGKEQALSLGVYPEISLKEARLRRDEEKARLNKRLDPSELRKETKQKAKELIENAFEYVALEWHSKQLERWSDSHGKDVKRKLELNIFPILGNRPINKIESTELLDCLRKVEARGAHALSQRLLQYSGKIFRYAIATGRCKHDIAADLRGALTPNKEKHQPAVKPQELPALMEAISNYEMIGEPLTRLALQLLAITFVRTRELIEARWQEFNLEQAMWIIPASRMKMKIEHRVPLSKQAISILQELKLFAGKSPYVFAGRTPDKPMSNNTLLFALYRMGYKSRMTGHGFRSVASTILNEQGFDGDAIERQLAHSESNAVRDAYNRAEYMEKRANMMQWYADHVMGAEPIDNIK